MSRGLLEQVRLSVHSGSHTPLSFAPPAWTEQAACSGMTREQSDAMFFAPPGSHPPVAAVALCSACPVQQNCLDFANDIGAEHGVWGGLSTPERKRRGR